MHQARLQSTHPPDCHRLCSVELAWAAPERQVLVHLVNNGPERWWDRTSLEDEIAAVEGEYDDTNHNFRSKASFWRAKTPAAPRALVLAPTRELASQIHLEAARLSFGSDALRPPQVRAVPDRQQQRSHPSVRDDDAMLLSLEVEVDLRTRHRSEIARSCAQSHSHLVWAWHGGGHTHRWCTAGRSP